MSEELRRAAYLQTLARLQPGWDHQSRSDLGAIKMQIELMVALYAAGSVDELRPVLERAVNAVRRFEDAMNLRSEALRGPQHSGDLLDLAAHINRLGVLLSMSANDLDIRCSVQTLPGPIWIEGGEPVLRETLNIVAAEMLFLCQPKEALTMRLEANGERLSLRIEAPRVPSEDAAWLAAVRAALAKFGGEVKTTSAALELDLVDPRAAVPR